MGGNMLYSHMLNRFQALTACFACHPFCSGFHTIATNSTRQLTPRKSFPTNSQQNHSDDEPGPCYVDQATHRPGLSGGAWLRGVLPAHLA